MNETQCIWDPSVVLFALHIYNNCTYKFAAARAATPCWKFQHNYQIIYSWEGNATFVDVVSYYSVAVAVAVGGAVGTGVGFSAAVWQYAVISVNKWG